MAGQILLSTQSLSKAYGPRPLFEGLSFGLFEGERTGLIGPNGAGKSTLLKILAGVENPDSGEVIRRRGLRVGYLPQEEETVSAGSVREEILSRLSDLGLEEHELEDRVEIGLRQAGFPDGDFPADKLSGGWRKRLGILVQVLRRPDLLLLDEPTNHLDLEGVLWLENFLTGLRFSFLVVTHDRRFLEKVSNRVVEVNKRYATGHFSCEGNYSRFLEKREELFAVQAATEDSLRNTVRREIEWLRRGAKARTTKQSARIQRAGELKSELSELEYRNSQDKKTAIDFAGSERRSKKLIDCKGLSKDAGGRNLFNSLSFTLGPGDKLGLLGANGSGKSTLLGILAGRMKPDAGSAVHAEGLRVVTFDQKREGLDLNAPLRRALAPGGEHVYYRGRPIHVAGWAERFLFSTKQLDNLVGSLSGGEQARVLIARLMLEPADVLLLDEPTNDLDIQSLEVLEDSLNDFPGALVLVTHDRYLLDRVSKEILALHGDGTTDFYAELSQWENREKRAPAAKNDAAAEDGASATAPAVKLTQKEYRELKNIEAHIARAETAVAAAQTALEDPSVAADPAELHKRHLAVDAAKEKVAGLMKRWAELEERR